MLMMDGEIVFIVFGIVIAIDTNTRFCTLKRSEILFSFLPWCVNRISKINYCRVIYVKSSAYVGEKNSSNNISLFEIDRHAVSHASIWIIALRERDGLTPHNSTATIRDFYAERYEPHNKVALTNRPNIYPSDGCVIIVAVQRQYISVPATQRGSRLRAREKKF
jgi:hypothetical protein